MNIYARHGDLVIKKLEKPVERMVVSNLTPVRDLVLVGGGSAPHTLQGACLHQRDGLRTIVRVAEPATLVHAGRHLAITLEPGDYEIYPLRERGDASDRAVDD